jgi:TetR/AcrR family transcriptional regulator
MIEKQRMRADDRRELILEAATRVFGDYGYYGTTTAQIAREAGVSQPYVIQVFGTKQQLFLEVIQRALDAILDSFRAVLPDEPGSTLSHRLGMAYVDLAANHGLLLSLMHAFVLGRDPVIGKAARDGFMKVYKFLRVEGGFPAADAQQFLSGGMLINTLVGLRMVDEYGDGDTDVCELLETALPEKLDVLLALADDPTAERTSRASERSA